MALAVDTTTKLFVKSVQQAIPGVSVRVQRSSNSAGQSRYVYIDQPRAMPIKVRISDHPVGMRRALWGEEALFIFAGAKPASWAVWLGDLRRWLTPALELSKMTSVKMTEGQDDNAGAAPEAQGRGESPASA